jgi:hypothetical protein
LLGRTSNLGFFYYVSLIYSELPLQIRQKKQGLNGFDRSQLRLDVIITTL